jgi:hypothetical protein
MDSITVLSAAATAWVESNDLNPRGAVFYPDLVKAIATRYNFQKFPEKIEDFDETKGVAFIAGKLGKTVIERLTIYTYGLSLQTRVSTEESKRLLVEGLEWASKELGLVYKPDMTKRWHYYSQITFYSKLQLMATHSAFQQLADRVSKSLLEAIGENLKYELTACVVNFDQLTRKHPLGYFSIQRRENTPFSENKYFSDAPLPTDVHIKLLEQFEADLSVK